LDDPVEQVRRTLRALVIATVLLYVVLGVGMYFTFSSSRTTHDALCTLRGDLQNRVAQSQRFLIEHPKGFAGIPSATIAQGLVNQQHTIDALSSLSC
jgi:hypothetical protein